MTAGGRAGRIRSTAPLLALIGAVFAPGGTVTGIRLRPEPVLATARGLVLRHRLRTLDGIHLAVVLEDVIPMAGSEGVELVTRDHDQAVAARALGLTVRS